MANHADYKRGKYTYKRGELVTTYHEIIKAMGYYHNKKYTTPTIKQVRLILNWLALEKMISVSPLQIECPTGADPTAYTRAYVGIKVVVINYDTYQDSKSYKGRHKDRPISPQGHDNNNEYKKDIYMSNFELFYKAYPKHQARKKAVEAWKKIKPSNDLVETMLTAIEKQKVHKGALKKQGEFVSEWPLPATWLNQARWEDEIPEVKSSW